MTEVPYPHPNPPPGSNAIGSFVIGVSPIGTISSFDVWTTIISQYANSDVITTLITDMSQYLDMTANFDAFYDTIWNVDTAIGRGLDIWGRIVGVSRVLALPSGDQPYFGFQEAGTYSLLTPFGQAPFFNGETLTNNYALSDDAYRVLILAKALANICNGSIPSINQLLLNLFPTTGNPHVVDDGGMHMTYRFLLPLDPVQRSIIQNSGVLPKSTGVSVSIDDSPI